MQGQYCVEQKEDCKNARNETIVENRGGGTKERRPYYQKREQERRNSRLVVLNTPDCDRNMGDVLNRMNPKQEWETKQESYLSN